MIIIIIINIIINIIIIIIIIITISTTTIKKGAQWLCGRVLDSRPRGRRFEPHRRQCGVVLEQDTFILA